MPKHTLLTTNHLTNMLTYRFEELVAELPFSLADAKRNYPAAAENIESQTVDIKIPFGPDGKLDKAQLSTLVEWFKGIAVDRANQAVQQIQAAMDTPTMSVEDAIEVADV